MQMEYTKELIVENVELEKVENYGRFQNDMIKLNIVIDENILGAIKLIGEDKFNDLLHEEEFDVYIEDNELVNYFLDKEGEFDKNNGDLDNDSKFILIRDAIDAMNNTLDKTIFGDVEFIESNEDEIKMYHKFGDMEILDNISKTAAGFIMSAKHVSYNIEEVVGKTYFVLTIDTESFEESLQNI